MRLKQREIKHSEVYSVYDYIANSGLERAVGFIPWLDMETPKTFCI